MTTTIIDDLNIPEDRREALSREAMRRGVPVAVLIRDWVLAKADEIARARMKMIQTRRERAAGGRAC